ncbi:MAG: hypothetical protein ACJAR2_002272 [Ilumatobacter sp.]|jgi:hypothetical protein
MSARLAVVLLTMASVPIVRVSPMVPRLSVVECSFDFDSKLGRYLGPDQAVTVDL